MHSYCRFISNNTRTKRGCHSDVHINKINIIHITNIQINKTIKHSLAHKNKQIIQDIKRQQSKGDLPYIYTYIYIDIHIHIHIHIDIHIYLYIQ